MDLRKAYDSVWHQGLWYKLDNLGIKGNLMNFLQKTYQMQQGNARTKHGMTNNFSIDKGVRQGCVLSPLLFTIYINDILNGSERKWMGVSSHYPKELQALLYADDLAITGASLKELNLALQHIEKWAEDWKMSFNSSKCKYMCINHKTLVEALTNGNPHPNYTTPASIHGKELEYVTSCRYLGYIVSYDLENTAHFQHLERNVRAAVATARPSLLSDSFGMQEKRQILQNRVFDVIAWSSPLWCYDENMYIKLSKIIHPLMKRSVRTPTSTSNLIIHAEYGLLPLPNLVFKLTCLLLHRMFHSKNQIITNLMDNFKHGTKKRNKARGGLIDKMLNWIQTQELTQTTSIEELEEQLEHNTHGPLQLTNPPIILQALKGQKNRKHIGNLCHTINNRNLTTELIHKAINTRNKQYHYWLIRRNDSASCVFNWQRPPQYLKLCHEISYKYAKAKWWCPSPISQRLLFRARAGTLNNTLYKNNNGHLYNTEYWRTHCGACLQEFPDTLTHTILDCPATHVLRHKYNIQPPPTHKGFPSHLQTLFMLTDTALQLQNQNTLPMIFTLPLLIQKHLELLLTNTKCCQIPLHKKGKKNRSTSGPHSSHSQRTDDTILPALAEHLPLSILDALSTETNPPDILRMVAIYPNPPICPPAHLIIPGPHPSHTCTNPERFQPWKRRYH
jgi:hypothetical protein